MVPQKVKIQRDSSIELLRIILAMGVIILHYNNASIGGGFKYVNNGGLNQSYLYIMQNLSICAVDAFILISGYFLSKNENRKFSRVVELIFQLIVFRLVGYFIECAIKKDFSFTSMLFSLLPVNYYAILYVVLYITSPYINILIKNLDKTKFRKMLFLFLIIFSVETTIVDIISIFQKVNGLSAIGLYGSQNGYTIVNFILLYFLGAYIRQYPLSLSKLQVLGGIITNLIIMYILSMIELKFQTN